MTQDGNQPNDDLGQLGNLIDGNPSTDWESDVYKGPEFGGSGGFGLALQLGAAHALRQLVATSPMKGWTAEVFTADRDAADLSGWGPPVDVRSRGRRQRHLLASRQDRQLGAFLDRRPGPEPPSRGRRTDAPLVAGLRATWASPGPLICPHA